MNPNVIRASLIGLGIAGVAAAAVRAEGPDRGRLETEAMGQAAEADRLFKAGDFAAALPLYEAERASRAALRDLRYEAYAARAIGCCHERLGDLDAAIAAWEAARALDARRDDRGFEGYDWLLIGQVQLRRERPEEAVAALDRAIPLLSKAIDRDHEADAQVQMGHALLALGQPGRAASRFDRARTLARELNDLKRRADACAGSGGVARAMDEPGPAAEWLSDAREAYEGLGRTAEAAAMDRLLGEALLALDHPDAAAARVEEAARAHERLGASASLADDLQFLATLRAGQGDLLTARTLARRAVAARRDADDLLGEVEARVDLAQLESLGDGWAAAARTLADALPLVRRDGSPADQVRLLILAADVEHRAGNTPRCRELLEEAHRVAEQADLGALRRLVADARQRLR